MGIEPYGEDGEDPFVPLEDALVVERNLRQVQAALQVAQLVDQLAEDGRGKRGGATPTGFRGSVNAIHGLPRRTSPLGSYAHDGCVEDLARR